MADAASIVMPPEDLERVTLIWPVENKPNFEIVFYRDETREFILHPTDGRPSIAVIRRVVAPEAKSVSATVAVEHVEAFPVEFGIALVNGVDPLPDHPDYLIRSWTPVMPGSSMVIAGTVEPDIAGSAHVIIGTRMTRDRSSHLAWAVFRKITFGG